MCVVVCGLGVECRCEVYFSLSTTPCSSTNTPFPSLPLSHTTPTHAHTQVLTTINHPAMQDAVASFAAAHNVPTDTQHQAGDGQQAGGKKPRLSDAAGAVAMV